MKSFFIATLFVAGVLAAPSSNMKAVRSPLCPAGLESTPQCCSTDVLGLADLDCQNRKYSPRGPYSALFEDTNYS